MSSFNSTNRNMAIYFIKKANKIINPSLFSKLFKKNDIYTAIDYLNNAALYYRYDNNYKTAAGIYQRVYDLYSGDSLKDRLGKISAKKGQYYCYDKLDSSETITILKTIVKMYENIQDYQLALMYQIKLAENFFKYNNINAMLLAYNDAAELAMCEKNYIASTECYENVIIYYLSKHNYDFIAQYLEKIIIQYSEIDKIMTHQHIFNLLICEVLLGNAHKCNELLELYNKCYYFNQSSLYYIFKDIMDLEIAKLTTNKDEMKQLKKKYKKNNVIGKSEVSKILFSHFLIHIMNSKINMMQEFAQTKYI